MKRLISGDYEVLEQSCEFGEMNSLIQFRIVTWECEKDNCGKPNDKQFENFESEFKALLNKYAI